MTADIGSAASIGASRGLQSRLRPPCGGGQRRGAGQRRGVLGKHGARGMGRLADFGQAYMTVNGGNALAAGAETTVELNIANPPGTPVFTTRVVSGKPR